MLRSLSFVTEVCLVLCVRDLSYLQVIFAVYSEAMAEYIPGHHHVRLHPVHC